MQSISVVHARPVEATEESQADKGIDHPLVSCGECGAIWRAHGRSLCPTRSTDDCWEGVRMILDGRQRSNLYVAMCNLETKECYTEEQLELQIWRFRKLLLEDAPWYDSHSRQLIQACYHIVCDYIGTHPNATVAIAFFKEEYAFAPEEDKTVFPEVVQVQERDAQYDLMKPSW